MIKEEKPFSSVFQFFYRTIFALTSKQREENLQYYSSASLVKIESSPEKFQDNQDIVGLLIDLSGEKNNSCIDFECGWGHRLFLLKRHFNNVYGTAASEVTFKASHLLNNHFGETCFISPSPLQSFPKPEIPINAILCESALQHLNKDEVEQVLKEWLTWLEPGGVCLVRLKKYPFEDLAEGCVYRVDDKEVGTRYFISWTMAEIHALVEKLNQYCQEQGLDITFTIQDPTSHLDGKTSDTPDFVAIIAQRSGFNSSSKSKQF